MRMYTKKTVIVVNSSHTGETERRNKNRTCWTPDFTEWCLHSTNSCSNRSNALKVCYSPTDLRPVCRDWPYCDMAVIRWHERLTGQHQGWLLSLRLTLLSRQRSETLVPSQHLFQPVAFQTLGSAVTSTRVDRRLSAALGDVRVKQRIPGTDAGGLKLI